MDPSVIAAASRIASRAAGFLFSENGKQQKSSFVAVLLIGILVTFCFPVIAISSGMQMLQDRISDLFDWSDFYSGLFDQSEEEIDQAFQRWMETDYPQLQNYSESAYPSLEMAYGISFYYQVIEGHSIFDEGIDFISIFTEDDREKVIEEIENIYQIDVPDNQQSSIASLGDSLSEVTEPDSIIPLIVDTSQGSGDLALYPENTYYTGGDPRAAAIWREAYHIGGGNPFYYFAIHGGWSPNQCTTFAWYRFYQVYGYDCGARSDGRYFAASVVNSHPDRFSLQYYPAAGAVVSFPPTATNSHGHVGFVEKVEGDYLWYSEGNYDGGGIRLNTKMNISSLTRAKCGSSWCIAYAVPKG